MDPAAAKQQIAERVKQANKFLVTVNTNPTVDQLAACIGLTLLLNKLGKHATAVFSGQVPSIIGFLQPEKTLQKNTDALRDFIISLDKNKADKLRYKVENDVVRIFITPYRTSLSEKDLVFSEGDFNVEVVLALGITQRTQIDQAVTMHGRILHDATVITVNAGVPKAPDIGQIHWADPAASSLSEMLVSISESFGAGLIDSQMATAFLTGIVAETERFSNQKTSPKVMTMSAQLMAAGANQQLIAEKLEPPAPPPQTPPAPPKKPVPPPKPKQPPLKPEGIINVPHDEGKKKENTNVELGTTEIHIDEQGNLMTDQQLRFDAQQQAKAEAENQPAAPPAPAAPTVSAPPPQTTPAPPQAPPPEAELSEPENRHAFLGTTAQPQMPGSPFPAANPGQPDWAAPYDLVPMDPMRQAGTGSSEFGSTPVGVNPEASRDNFSQGHGIATPEEAPIQPTPVSSVPVDQARSAVEQAIAAVPATSPAPEATPAPTAPIAPASDTPMLVLPSDSSSSVTATQPIATQTPAAPASQVAPPPVPPPLNVAPGAVVPNIPPPE
ncbi:MAG TPA: hypothetical protein VHD84_02540 [Candidatus Saccharimonadales bacterium]|nr:hypothetical protein [Candidatus Saccharimonadales bacterium]